MNQCSRLQSLAGRLPGESGRGDCPQFVVHQGDELPGGERFAPHNGPRGARYLWISGGGWFGRGGIHGRIPRPRIGARLLCLFAMSLHRDSGKAAIREDMVIYEEQLPPS
jgi:hypothetical protein